MKLLTSCLLSTLTLVLATLGLMSCGVSSAPPFPVGDFNFTISSQSLFVPIGTGARSLQISVQPIGGFNLPVTVSLSGLPDGVTTTPASPFTVAPGGSQTVAFSAARGTSPGVGTVTAAAIARGTVSSLSHSGTFSLSAAAPVYAYVPNALANNVLGFSVDANTGGLTQLAGSPFTLPASPTMIVSTTQGAFFYGVGQDAISHTWTLTTYVIDPATGSLTQGQVINDDTLANSTGIAASPNGKFLYVMMPGCIRVYLIDPVTGNLTLSSCSSVPAQPWQFVVVPPGNVAYAVTGYINGTQVYLYSVDQNDGSLALVQSAQSPFPFAGKMSSDPLGRALYVLTPGLGHLSCGDLLVLGIDQQTTALTPLGQYGTACPQSITFDPADQYAYLSGTSGFLITASIDGFRSDSSGSLSYLPGSPFATQLSPDRGVVEPSQGKFLIEIIDENIFNSGSTTLTSFAIDPQTGALSQVPATAITATNSSPADLLIVAMPQ